VTDKKIPPAETTSWKARRQLSGNRNLLAAMMAEREVAVFHTTVMRWVLRYVCMKRPSTSAAAGAIEISSLRHCRR